MAGLISWIEKGVLPDRLVRACIRSLLRARLQKESTQRYEERYSRLYAFRDQLKKEPIARSVETANAQHYEVPADLFKTFMGPHLKYSSGYWSDQATTLAESEKKMLTLTCERAEIEDGQHILELGCGWGSLSLWMARTYPRARITAVSNSTTQKAYIDSHALPNLNVITADMNTFSTDTTYDRIVSIEMFEHMRNWPKLLERIQGWLTPEGRLFIHIFVHRELAYVFNDQGQVNWMSDHFFKEGMMPAEPLLNICNDALIVEKMWRVNGTHYGKTLRAWLENIDKHRTRALHSLTVNADPKQARIQWRRWRIFFMACEELFNWGGGNEWYIAHYRLRKR
jgi:cyclopropane-fatty-acyl-phospholipid synthase